MLSVAMVLTSLLTFTVIYGILIVIDAYLLVKFAKAGPMDEQSPASLPGTVS